MINLQKSDRKKEEDNNLVTSYMTLRNLIGFSGALLPIVLAIGTVRSDSASLLEPSISDYYYTSTGDILVVLLSTVAVFLFTYKGYTWKENSLTKFAALAAFGIAFSPTKAKSDGYLTVHFLKTDVPKIAGFERHLIFAAIFFISIAIISLIYFPKTNSKVKDIKWKRSQKAKRNIIYYFCGWTILFCVTSIAIYFCFFAIRNHQISFPIIFVFETIAVEAFALSWLTKGETLLPDGEHYVIKAFRKFKSTRLK
jgi:hypothetical protein